MNQGNTKKIWKQYFKDLLNCKIEGVAREARVERQDTRGIEEVENTAIIEISPKPTVEVISFQKQ